jgi:hypothetical protein
MKTFLFLSSLFIALSCFSQDTIPSTGMGSHSFDHLDTAVNYECRFQDGYVVKVKKKNSEVKKDLWITRLVNDVVNRKLTLLQADSLLKIKQVKARFVKYGKPGLDVKAMEITGTYIQFLLVSARRESTGQKYVGATLKSTYKLYCKNNPAVEITEVKIDIDFFKEKVMKQITCPYQVFQRLELGDANLLGLELHIAF